MAWKVTGGYEFRKKARNRASWHIAHKNSNPGEVPLCSRSGIYSQKTDILPLKEMICPECFEEGQKSDILVYKRYRAKKEK